MKSDALPTRSAAARISALALLMVFGAGCLTTRSESLTPPEEFIGDGVIHFVCLEQRQVDLRPTPCRLDVDERSVEPIVADTEAAPGSGPAIAPDRRHVAFIANTDPTSFDDPFVFTVLDAGDRPVGPIDDLGSTSGRVWTPSGDALVATTDTGVVFIPIDGSRSSRVDFDPPAQPYDVAVSPDGTMIAAAVDGSVFTGGPSRLAVYRLDDGNQVSTTDLEFVSDVAWSPGGRVAASSSAGLHILEPASGDSTTIGTPTDERFFELSWSRDGTQLAVIVGSALFLYDADTWQPTQLTPDGLYLTSSSPAWSPDGDQIVVAGHFGLDEQLPHLILVDSATGALDDLTPDPRDNQGYAFPVWR